MKRTMRLYLDKPSVAYPKITAMDKGIPPTWMRRIILHISP